MAPLTRHGYDAGPNTRSAAELNPLYDILGGHSRDAPNPSINKRRKSSRARLDIMST
jgi:hypothetical protein